MSRVFSSFMALNAIIDPDRLSCWLWTFQRFYPGLEQLIQFVSSALAFGWNRTQKKIRSYWGQKLALICFRKLPRSTWRLSTQTSADARLRSSNSAAYGIPPLSLRSTVSFVWSAPAAVAWQDRNCERKPNGQPTFCTFEPRIGSPWETIPFVKTRRTQRKWLWSCPLRSSCAWPPWSHLGEDGPFSRCGRWLS